MDENALSSPQRELGFWQSYWAVFREFIVKWIVTLLLHPSFDDISEH